MENPKYPCLILCGVIWSAVGTELSLCAAEPASLSVRTVTINRKVSDFPTNEDLSTPEAAYATLHRAWAAEGEAAFARLSITELAKHVPSGPAKPLPAQEAAIWLGAEVLEVTIAYQTNAVILARLPPGTRQPIDLRSFRPEKGRWLNAGNNMRMDTVEEGRREIAVDCAAKEVQALLASRPPIASPEEHLRPFVEFLRREAKDPQDFLLQALANHRLVILGEVHHRPRYWAFYSSLVQAAAFAERAGVIYMELPANDQGLVEQFLSATNYDPQPIITTLRDMKAGWVLGWPDQPMLDFFKAVRETNQRLPRERRLRVVLTDVDWPWAKMHQPDDYLEYRKLDRDERMAANIARDLRDHAADSRHALFIVGYGHAMVNVNVGGWPLKSAGWRLCEELGEANVFAVFPHSPVMGNFAPANGRIALGLFETAFQALTNQPMAFPLDHGPFGEHIYDASLDDPTKDSFSKGFHAYLYLGPLEDEVFSPLIPGFFDGAFVQEADRRCRILSGKGLVEGGLKRLDGETIVESLSKDWGQPRADWSASRLGPLWAWEKGAQWEKN
jgi:hypothetical protein